MASILEMTQLSPTMSEGTIVKWEKKEGDAIHPGDVIAQVETDKAVMEMEAYDSGVILAIVAGDGSKVKVGLPIAVIGKVGEDAASFIEQAKNKFHSASNSVVVELPPKPQVAPKQEEPVAVITRQVSEPVVEELKSIPQKSGDRIFASPLAKSIALKNGIDIKDVHGTGPGGRIVKRDVLDSISPQSTSNKNSQILKSRPDKKIDISGMRNVIAQRLTSSKVNLPHFYLTLEVDAEPVSLLRENINKSRQHFFAKEGDDLLKLSINDFIVKASAVALREVPGVNSSWRGTYILEHGRVDIGIAVALDGGLITPYVRSADQKSLLEIGVEIRELAQKARERKLKPEEYTDGTFTISNLGMFGIEHFTAIINEPEAAILAVGSMVEKPVVKNGSIVPGKTITMTLSCDHRVVDGALGARFLGVFKECLEHPYILVG